ncbi:MAG TPA: PRC-barrel domain-containing protein, partial [Dehalococcoidia bacterium]|nr:PRC-barrel domain-containing protein [Dehalococcoidia bacterium]
MLETVSTLEHLGIHARDGDIGRIGDVLFDDQSWTVRYLVVRTGGWLHRRRVLLSPIAILDVDEAARTVSVDLTREQIAGSPPLDTDMPLSRQMELKYRDYFSWPAYWVATYLDAYHRKAYPRLAEADREVSDGERPRQEPALPNIPEHDPHLRSTATITGYAVYASDGPRSPAG